jgi:hypothetical protein
MSSEGSPVPTHATGGKLREVRYSLRELMAEVESERVHSSIGQELMDQNEIRKLFARKQKGRRERDGK